MKRTTETITFSLPPAMAAQVRAVMQAEGRTMSDLVREALRLYMEEREWRQSIRYERLQAHSRRCEPIIQAAFHCDGFDPVQLLLRP